MKDELEAIKESTEISQEQAAAFIKASGKEDMVATELKTIEGACLSSMKKLRLKTIHSLLL